MKKAKPVKKQEAPKSVEAVDYLARIGVTLLILAAFGYGFYSSFNSSSKSEPQVKVGKCYSNAAGGDIIARVDYIFTAIRDEVSYYYVDLSSVNYERKGRTMSSFKDAYPEEVPCALLDINRELVVKFQILNGNIDHIRDSVAALDSRVEKQQKRLKKLEKQNESSKH